MNSRPLYYASNDPNDCRSLTPNDFLNRPTNADVTVGDLSTSLPKDHYRYAQRALNLFWDMWKIPYLQLLVTRKKWQHSQRNFAVGDVVIEYNPHLQRGLWRTGKVVAVFPGENGFVRAVGSVPRSPKSDTEAMPSRTKLLQVFQVELGG